MKDLYIRHYFPILFLLLLFNCNNNQVVLKKVDLNMNNYFNRKYDVIDINYNINKKVLINKSNEKILAFYFFDASCPGCWFKYEESCDTMNKYKNLFETLFFAYNTSPEFISNRKFRHYDIKMPIMLIDKKPNNLNKDIFYFSKEDTVSYNFIEQKLTRENLDLIVDRFK